MDPHVRPRRYIGPKSAVHPVLFQPGGLDILVICPITFHGHMLPNGIILCPNCNERPLKTNGWEKGFRPMTSFSKLHFLKIRSYRCDGCPRANMNQRSNVQSKCSIFNALHPDIYKNYPENIKTSSWNGSR